jgi:hypothetical protein
MVDKIILRAEGEFVPTLILMISTLSMSQMPGMKPPTYDIGDGPRILKNFDIWKSSEKQQLEGMNGLIEKEIVVIMNLVLPDTKLTAQDQHYGTLTEKP